MGSLFSSYSASIPYKDSIKKFITLRNGNLAVLELYDINIFSGANLEKILTISPESDSEDNLIIPQRVHSSKLYLIDLIQVNNGNLIVVLNYAIKVIRLSENNSYEIIQTITRGFQKFFYKIIEIKNDLFCFETSSLSEGGVKSYQIQIYNYNLNNNNYNHSTTLKVGNYVIDSLYLDTNELVYFDGKVKFLNLDTWNTKNVEDNFIFDNYLKDNNIICKLDNNHILVCDNKFFYIINIVNYTIDKKINNHIDNIFIKSMKNDSKGNIMVLMVDNPHLRICKPTFYKKKDYFIIYKYNNLNLEKVFELEESNFRINCFHKYPDNQIIFYMSSRVDESKYIKTLGIIL